MKLNTLSPKRVREKVKQLKTDRGVWENHWQDIADYILPRRDSVIVQRTPGEKKSINIYDNTAIVSNELLAGALHSMLTSPNTYWFEFTTGDDALDSDSAVRAHLQAVRNIMHAHLVNTNFYTENHELYLDGCALGTGCMLIEEDDIDDVRFSTKFIAEYYIDEDSKGNVNQVYREWKWDAQKIVQAFGIDKVPQKVKEAYEKNKTNEMFTIIHAVYPESMVVPASKIFVSQYILCEGEHELKVEQFLELPYVVPRWSKCAGEKYGRGPGMASLPEVKTLNKMAEIVLKGAQKVVDPPIQIPDDGFIMPIITAPGGINYYRAGSNDFIRPVFNDTRIDFGVTVMSEKRQRVREAFYVDQLQLGTGPQMTATEVMQRTEERMRLLGPMTGRWNKEFLQPTIDRVYRIMERKKRFPEPPEILKNRKIGVRYSSVIAKSQKVTEAQAITRTLQTMAPFIEMDQSILDNFNGDGLLKVVSDIFGMHQKGLRSDAEVRQVRNQRAEAQAQAQQMQQQAFESQQMESIAKTRGAIGGG